MARAHPTRFLSLMLLAVTLPAWAGHYKLFNHRGKPIPSYDETVQRLRVGDSVEFSNGTTRHVMAKPNQGGTTIVFANEEGRASRIPRRILDRMFIDMTVAGYSPLRATVAQMIELYTSSYIEGEHVEVELLPADSIALSDWAPQYEAYRAAPHGAAAPHLDDMYAALIEFAASFAAFSYVGDYKPAQVHWDGSRWVLVDWIEVYTAAEKVLSAFPTLRELWDVRSIRSEFHLSVEALIWTAREDMARQGKLPCPALLKR